MVITVFALGTTIDLVVNIALIAFTIAKLIFTTLRKVIQSFFKQ